MIQNRNSSADRANQHPLKLRLASTLRWLLAAALCSLALQGQSLAQNAPVITSDGGAATGSISYAENGTAAVTTVTATDADAGQTKTFSISGTDAARFNINSSSGALTFKLPPNFENPVDANADNAYLVTVTVTDNDSPALSDSQDLTVTVTNVDESNALIAIDNTGANDAISAGNPRVWNFRVTSSGSSLLKINKALFGLNAGSNTTEPVTFAIYSGLGGDVAGNTLLRSVTIAASAVTGTFTTMTYFNFQELTLTSGDYSAKLSTNAASGGSTAYGLKQGKMSMYDAASYVDSSSAKLSSVYWIQDSNNTGTASTTFTADPTQPSGVALQVPNIAVYQGNNSSGTPITDAQASPVSVGTTTSNTALNYNITIKNEGDASLTIGGAQFSGAGAAAYSLTGTSPITTLAAGASVTFTVTFTPALAGTFLSTLTLSSNDPDEAEFEIPLTGKCANPPTITSNGGGSTGSVSLAENLTAATTVTATDPDAGQTLSYDITGGTDSAKFSIDANTGALTFLTAPNFEIPTDSNTDNIYVVTVRVRDNDSPQLEDTQTLSITITNINDAPLITSNGGGASANINVVENTTAVTTVTSSDADLPAQNRTYSISGGADSAKFSIDPATGALTFIAAPDYETPTDTGANNVYEVVVTVTDDGSPAASVSQTINVTVTSINEAPTITSNGGGAADSFSMAENLTAVTTVTATDPDVGQTLSYDITGGTDSAKFTINNSTGALSFVSAPNFEIPGDSDGDNVYVVTVRVRDDAGVRLEDSQTLTITITDANDAPVITSNGGGASASISIAENTTAVTTVTATDSELPPQNKTYSISGGADSAKFSIDPATGALTFIAAPDYETPTDGGTNNVYEVIVKVTDDGSPAAFSTQSISVTITNVDEAPVISSAATSSIAENSPMATVALDVNAADPEAGSLSYSISGTDAALFAIDSTTGEITFLASPNFEDPKDLNTDNAYLLTVTATEVAGAQLSSNQAVTITVTNVNEAITITSNGGGASAAINLAENLTAVTTVTASDIDAGQTKTFSIMGGADAALFSIDSGTGALTFNTAPDFENPTDAGASADNVYEVTVRVVDNGSPSLDDSQAISVTITNANDAPVISSYGGGNSGAVSFAENTLASTMVADVDASDQDNNTLTYSVGGTDAALFNINGADGKVTFKTSPNFESPQDAGGNNVYDIVVTVTDNGSGALTDTQAIAITVTNVNEAITITSNGGGATAAVNVAENTTAVTTVIATDIDAGQTQTYSITGGADSALFTIDAGTGALAFAVARDFEVKADADLDNVYVVEVTATDNGTPSTLSDSQVISVTITNVNDAPVITSNGGGSSASLNFAENTPISTTVVDANASDDDSDTLTYSLSGPDAALFNIDPATGIITFKVSPNFETPSDSGGNNVYDITVTVTDNGTGTLTDTQTIAITVTDANDAPVITSAASYSVPENTTAVGTATATDQDSTHSTTFSISGTDAGKFDIVAATGVITFKTAPNFEGPTDSGSNNVYDIVITATDDGSPAQSSTKNVAITVTNVNEAPVITSNGGGSTGSINYTENSTAAITTVTASDVDASQTKTYSISGGADSGKFTIVSNTGVLTWAASPNFESPTDVGADNVYEVIVRIVDNGSPALDDTQTLSITVTNVNDAPVITSNGGGASGSLSVAENTSLATTVTATDQDVGQTQAYAIIGGADSALFTIDAATGALNFITAPDFEVPADFGANNVYNVTVRVVDNGSPVLNDTQDLVISVTNVVGDDTNPIISGLYSRGNNSTSYQLFATVNPNGVATTATFQYSTDPTFATGVTTSTSYDIGSGSSGVEFSTPVSGLSSTSTYYWRVVATRTGPTNFTSGVQRIFRVSVMPSYTQSVNYGKVLLNASRNVWGRTWDGVAPYSATFDFGDGTPTETQTGLSTTAQTDYIDTTHAYNSTGTKNWSLTVTDATGSTVQRTGAIRVLLSQTVSDRVHMAMEKGLEYLYLNPTEINSTSVYYPWVGRGMYDCYTFGTGASVLLSFEENEHLPGEDWVEEIYAPLTIKIRNYILDYAAQANISDHSDGVAARNQDRNDNGKGVYWPTTAGHQTYSNGLAAMALILSVRNKAEAEALSPLPAGSVAIKAAYSNLYLLIQDFVDQMLYSQGDGGNRGGYIYSVTTPTEGRDASTMQWPALALGAAMDRLEETIPAWYWENAIVGFNALKNPSTGGVGYRDPTSWNNLAKTGGALAALSFAGAQIGSHPDATDYYNYIRTYWTAAPSWSGSNAGWTGQWYAMYGLKKGLGLQGVTNMSIGATTRSWKQDFNAWLLGDATLLDTPNASLGNGYRSTNSMFGQLANGSWKSNIEPASFNNSTNMDTAKAILILSDAVTRPVPVAVISPIPEQTNKPAGRSFTLDGSDSYHLDANSAIATYQWDFNSADGINWNNPDATGPIVTNPGYANVGTYTITLRVSDNKSPTGYATTTADVTVTSADVAPIAVAKPVGGFGGYAGRVGQPITLDGSASYDPDGDAITLYSWDLNGDGVYGDATGVTTTVTFSSPYQGSIGLRVTANGKTSNNIATIDIQAGDSDLVANSLTLTNVVRRTSADAVIVVTNDPASGKPFSNVKLRLYNGDPYAGGGPVGPIQTLNFTAGETKTITLTNVPLGGAGTIWVFLDTENSVVEVNETNNILGPFRYDPEIDVSTSAYSNIIHNFTVETFETLIQGQTSVTRTYRFFNTGTMDLTGISVSKAGSFPGDYSITQPSVSTLPKAVELSSCTTTSGSTTVTCASTTGLSAGLRVTGPGIPDGTTVASVTDAGTFELSQNASSSGSGRSLVAAAGSTFTVTFSPQGPDDRNATIQVNSNDWDEAPFNLLVTGFGRVYPTDITLTPPTIAENNAANATVGTLSTTDGNVADTFTYTLVSGTGDTDNASFTIVGNSLSIVPSADYETKNSYSLRVRTTDQTGLSFEEALTVTILQRNEAPVLAATKANPTTTENSGDGTGSSDAFLFTGSGVTDIDFVGATLGTGKITVTLAAYQTGDVLTLPTSVAHAANAVQRSGNSVQISNGSAWTTIGTVDATSTGLATGLVINLNSSATEDNIGYVLDKILFRSTADNPTLNNQYTTRTYSLVVNDGNNNATAGGPAALDSNTISGGTITIAPVNDNPIVDLNGSGSAGLNHSVTWTESANSAHTTIATVTAASATDSDNTRWSKVTLTFDVVPNGSSEVLNIGGSDFSPGTSATNTDIGSWLVSSNGSNRITIAPDGANSALMSEFVTLLQGITYINNTDNATAGNRVVTIEASDAGHDNAGTAPFSTGSATLTITVVPTNDQPTFDTLAGPTYFENAINATPALLDGSITITDIDSPDYNGGTLAISGLVANDVVSLPSAPAAAAGAVRLSAGNVDYHDGTNWVTVGTATGGSAATFTITFNASSTVAIVEAVTEALTFATTSDNPILTRTLTYTLNDNDGNTTQPSSHLVTIKLDNDAPVLAGTTGLTFVENGSAAAFVSSASSSDSDAQDSFYSAGAVGSLTVSLDTYVTGDTLSINNQGTGVGQIGVAGANLSYSNTVIGTISGGSASNLVVTFTNAAANNAAVAAIINNLRFVTASEDPTVNNTDPSRVFTISLNDGGNRRDATSSTGALTGTLTGTITITAVNDQLALTVANPALSYVENGSALSLDTAATLSDADDSQMASATISVSANFRVGDLLEVTTTGTSITANYDANTGVLSLTGADSLANYQTVLRSLTYRNGTEDPQDKLARSSLTVAYSVVDANSDAVGATTATDSRVINLDSVNDAPTLAATKNDPTYTENGNAVQLFSASTVSDVDAEPASFGGGNIRVTFAAYHTGDVIRLPSSVPHANNAIQVSGSNVQISDGTSWTTIGTVDGTANGQATGLTLNLNASATEAMLGAVINSIEFITANENPAANQTKLTRTYSIVVNDGDNNAKSGTPGADSNAITAGTLTIAPVNDAPLADLNGGTAGNDNAVTWTEVANGSHTAVNLASAAAFTDPADNLNLSAMTLTLTGLADGDSESLTIAGTNFPLNTAATSVDVGSFLVSYNATTKVVTIVPDGSLYTTLANFQALMRGVTYNNSTNNPTAGNRNIAVVITDAGLNDTSATDTASSISRNITLTVTPTNDQPTFAGVTAISYFENALNTAAAALNGNLTLTDIDSPDYNGGSLAISGLVTGDVVSLPTTAAAALGSVKLESNDVKYHDGSAWATVGTASGGTANTLTLTFNATATVAIVEAVAEALTFATTSDAPATSRTLTYTLDDNDGNSTQPVTQVVTIKLDNDAPALAATSSSASYNENAVAVALTTSATFSDPDASANFYNAGANAATLTVSFAEYVTGDVLSVANLGGGAGQIGFNTGTISYAGNNFATASGGAAGALTITMNSASATRAAIEALINALRFHSTSDNPTMEGSKPTRALTITLNDAANTKDATSTTTALTATLTGTITITPSNDVPTLDLDANNSSLATVNDYKTIFSRGGSPVAIADSDATLADLDNAQLQSMTIVITNLQDSGSETISATGTLPGGISGNFDAGTGTYTLTGPASPADFQAALLMLRYNNSSATPSFNDRILQIKANDGTGDSLVATSTVRVADLLVTAGTPVSENNTYAFFTVRSNVGEVLNLVLSNTADLTDRDATIGGFSIQYKVSGGSWTNYTWNGSSGDRPTIAGTAGDSGTVLVRVPIISEADNTFEDLETFVLTATATSASLSTGDICSISDKGTGNRYTDEGVLDNSGTPDDDNIIIANNISVNERSPYAVFTLQGLEGEKFTLATSNGLTNSTTGITGIANIEVLVAGSWVSYSAPATFPDDGDATPSESTTMLARVDISVEQDSLVDNAEKFRLTPTTRSGTVGTAGTATIYDDGNGSIWIAGNTTSNADDPFAGGYSGPLLDDDRSMSLNTGLSFNENSPYAVFRLTGFEGQRAILGVSNGGAGQTTGLSTVEWLDGSTWKAAGAYTTLPDDLDGTPAESSSILIRVDLTPERDDVSDNAETFNATATTTSGVAASGGLGTVYDQYNGSIFLASNTSQNADDPTAGGYSGPLLDDDRVLSVTNVTINENSPYANFEITGIEGQITRLSIDNTQTTGLVTLQIWNGAIWATPASPFIMPQVGAGLNGEASKVIARIGAIPERDMIYEAAETFKLVAGTNSNTPSSGGVGTIKDDNTGSIFLETNNTLTPDDPTAGGYVGPGMDDDRAEIAVYNSTSTLDGTTELFDGLSVIAMGNASECFDAPKTITVKNIGVVNLEIYEIKFAGGNATCFVDGTNPAPTLANPLIVPPNGGTVQVTAIFKTTVEGPHTTTMTIVNNDGNEANFDITLNGNGVVFRAAETIASAPGDTLQTIENRDYDPTHQYLTPQLSWEPQAGESITALDMVGGGTILGQFNGLPEGGVVAVPYGDTIHYFKATYSGGPDGKDLVLTCVEPPADKPIDPAWVWMAGPKARNNLGVYNAGGSSPMQPGARQGSMGFQAMNGNLWIFGGYGYGGAATATPRYLNDLWRYNRALGTWDYIVGDTLTDSAGRYASPSPSNPLRPMARHTAATWVACDSYFYMFGGRSMSGRMSDFWKFDSAAGEWILLSGGTAVGSVGTYGTKGVPATTNIPRARANAVACTYKCELLLFGGSNNDSSQFLNDLWLYHVYTGEWEWVYGSSGTNANSVYGTKGVADAANGPGARRDATGWVVGDKFYLFGGRGMGASGTSIGDLNDLWSFDLTTRQWTWLSGANTLNDAGSYPGSANATELDGIYPSARSASTGWATVDKRIWKTGGFTTRLVGNKTVIESLNDIWIFNTNSGKWMWRSGSKIGNSNGSFGTKGVMAQTNHPAARWTGNTFVGVDGSQWFFGGGGKDGMGGTGRCADMWRLHIYAPAGTPVDQPQADLAGLGIVNNAPSTSDSSASTSSLVTVGGTLTATDPDNDPIQFLTAGGGSVTAQGTFNLQPNGQWTYTPSAAFTGSANFSFLASDAYGGSSPVRTLRVTVGTNPLDLDNDGIADSYEVTKWGSTVLGRASDDSDGDGQTNFMEFVAGTDPLDGSNFLVQELSVQPAAGGQNQFRFNLKPVRPGILYHLETTNDQLLWQHLGTFNFNTSGNAVIESLDPASDALRLYRIRLESTLQTLQSPTP